MTIKSPKKNKGNSLFLFTLIAVILVGGLLYIHQYNALADLKFKIKETEQKISELEVENAQLKQQVYQITDPSNLEETANSQGLVMEDNPKYLHLSQWVSDSSY